MSQQHSLLYQSALRAQGTGFSEAVAGLEAEVRSLRAANTALSEDNRGCYAQIRAKDKDLDVAAIRIKEAACINVENGVAHPLDASYRLRSIMLASQTPILP